MPQQDFAAQVSRWVARSKVRVKAVRDSATQEVIHIMQEPVAAGGNMPVDTGFLRASGQAVVGETPPPLVPHPGGVNYGWDAGAVMLTIANARLEDTITFAYGAEYAVFQEYGTRHMAGHRFVGLAAQQWPRLVERFCQEMQSRAGR